MDAPSHHVEEQGCPACSMPVQELEEGLYLCIRCVEHVRVPVGVDPSMFYSKPVSPFKAMCLPAVSLLPLIFVALGYGPMIPLLVLAAAVYVVVDGVIWGSARGVRRREAVAIRALFVLVAALTVWIMA